MATVEESAVTSLHLHNFFQVQVAQGNHGGKAE